MSYTNLKIKLNAIWQLNKNINLINLGYDYYLIKFQQTENFNKILQHGPWFIGSQYFTIRHQEPKFNPALAHTNYTTMCNRLQELLTKYYDLQILQKIAAFIGTLIKIDTFNVYTSRGHYARLCILALLVENLPTKILVGIHTQLNHYEDSSIMWLFRSYYSLRHNHHQCFYLNTSPKYPNPIYK